jgi:hypothetical protein
LQNLYVMPSAPAFAHAFELKRGNIMSPGKETETENDIVIQKCMIGHIPIVANRGYNYPGSDSARILFDAGADADAEPLFGLCNHIIVPRKRASMLEKKRNEARRANIMG